MSEFEGNKECLSQIVGKELTAVNFVLDYLVFQFNDCFLTVTTTVSVRTGDQLFQPDDSSYRDSLCERITHAVTSTTLVTDKLVVHFDDQSDFVVSLSEEGRVGNEAIIFQFPESGQMQMLVLHII
jgi:hypothetical protein